MKGFFKTATVASAAAALSLALGGGVAEAQGVEGPPLLLKPLQSSTSSASIVTRPHTV